MVFNCRSEANVFCTRRFRRLCCFSDEISALVFVNRASDMLASKTVFNSGSPVPKGFELPADHGTTIASPIV